MEGGWEKNNWFGWVFVSFFQCNRVFSCLLKLHYYSTAPFHHTRYPLPYDKE